jgi:hypothetical protein
MAVMDVLEKAQGGHLFRKLGELAGLAPSDARRATEALCPSIAARLHEKAREPQEFQKLLALLEDNDGDLLESGDPGSSDVREDGQSVLISLYETGEAVQAQAHEAAEALRMDRSSIERLQPIAASLVLAVLSDRYRQVDETEAGEVSQTAGETDQNGHGGEGKSTILGIAVAAIGTAIMRAVINRLMPRRRRTRYSYATRGQKRRRKRRREVRLEDLFKNMLR